MSERDPLNVMLEEFTEALQVISEAAGAFSRDPNEHARNCIRDMQAEAYNVLSKHGIVPRGVPVDKR